MIDKNARWFKIVREVLIVAVIFGAAAIWRSWDHVSTGAAAPPFELATLEGTVVNSNDLRGKPVMLYFWATWCGVCSTVSPNIDSVHGSAGDDAHVLSINVDSGPKSKVQKYVDERGVTYPVLLGDHDLTDKFGVSAFPTLYFLDADGRVVTSTVGYTSTLGARLRLLWAGL